MISLKLGIRCNVLWFQSHTSHESDVAELKWENKRTAARIFDFFITEDNDFYRH